jgi:hypothetical protein
MCGLLRSYELVSFDFKISLLIALASRNRYLARMRRKSVAKALGRRFAVKIGAIATGYINRDGSDFADVAMCKRHNG